METPTIKKIKDCIPNIEDNLVTFRKYFKEQNTDLEAALYGDEATDDMRLAFELRFSRKLFANYQPIDTHKLINYTFIDTAFDKMDEWVVIDKL